MDLPFIRSACWRILVLSALLLTGCSGGDSAAEPTPTPLPTSVVAAKPIYTVERGDVITKIQLPGRVAPVQSQSLYFGTDGRIRAVYVKAGDEVTQGQVLADLEVFEGLDRQKRQDDINLRRAEINLANAYLDLEAFRNQGMTLWQQTYDLPKMERQVELAQLALDEVKLQAEDLSANLEAAQIIAPFNGKVINLMLSEGSNAKAYEEVLRIGDLAALEISLTATSDTLSQLSEGMSATVKFRLRPGEEFAGSVRQLPYPYGTGGGTTEAERDPSIRVSIAPEALGEMALGDSVEVTIVTEEKDGVLWVPPAAVRTFDTRTFVVVQDDAGQRRVDVKLGIKNQERVEILEGLEEGQTVIAP